MLIRSKVSPLPERKYPTLKYHQDLLGATYKYGHKKEYPNYTAPVYNPKNFKIEKIDFQHTYLPKIQMNLPLRQKDQLFSEAYSIL